MSSFHWTNYTSTVEDHPGQKQVKEFARCIERLYIFPKRNPGGRIIEDPLGSEIRGLMLYAYPKIDTTRYLRERFRCDACCKIGDHPDKDKVRKQTKFCPKCFQQNVSINNVDFNIIPSIDLNHYQNIGKIRYERTTKPMVKKKLEKIRHETTRVIQCIAEIEEMLTLICEIYRYILIEGSKIYPSDHNDYYIYCLEQYRDNYWSLCKYLKKYLDKLPDIEHKYLMLQETQSRKDMCTYCFKNNDELTSKLKKTKNGMLCKQCEVSETKENAIETKETQELLQLIVNAKLEIQTLHKPNIHDEFEKLKFIIKAECPICNETFREFDPKKMIQARCGYHSFCVECADSWKKSCQVNYDKEATCPVCRGPF